VQLFTQVIVVNLNGVLVHIALLLKAFTNFIIRLQMMMNWAQQAIERGEANSTLPLERFAEQ